MGSSEGILRRGGAHINRATATLAALRQALPPDAWQVRRTTQMHWSVLQSCLPALYRQLPMEAEQKKRFEASLKNHLGKVCETFRNAPRFDLHGESGRAGAKAIAAATEEDLAGILDGDGLRKFRAWKTAPDNRAAIYFGEPPEERPAVQRPAPASAPASAPLAPAAPWTPPGPVRRGAEEF